ncbi:MAG: bifunctional (p)ppGpp synthetase/guanosine-3',5'-bis(diphosphate) 3'-pyrophosphohydrolase [Burkholderiales bacterium]|nr:bifunctional (p)ppGpp synthetase/guanosine-3',5'-bis(diphosphate) 3'-pyrophosphohydrolase [Burkholderiales bacterium]
MVSAEKLLTAPTQASNAAAASFALLQAKLDYIGPEGMEQVKRAYRFADEAHLGVTRRSGEPYITHPIAVALQCTEWKLDSQALMAALLHDVMEDCGVTKADLVEKFGANVAELVDGLTKLDKLNFETQEEGQVESFRKMLLAMARDVRVILVKLADRTHNMRTMEAMPRSRWKAISSETLEIYAPIAHRLGLNQTYRELQDLAFRHLRPWRYQVLEKAVMKARSRRRDLLQKLQRDVEGTFKNAKLPIHIFGREKTLFSIYQKMDQKHLSFAQVTDIYGMRILMPNLVDCYTGLGILHQLYKPVPGKFKDHIAIAKVNGYQSLHTTLVGPAGINVEFQLRTEAMHVIAESGVAAHWMYKSSDPGHERAERLGTQWLQSLLDIQDETRDAAEFWDHVKVDLFPDAVYVFTPKSHIMALPRGATVVDFAYAVHTNVGEHTLGANVNGQPVSLRSELSNGDVVEIITATDTTPNPAWLGFVKTGRARSKIRHYFKTRAQSESKDLGEKLLLQGLRAEGFAQLPATDQAHKTLWEKLLRFTGSKNLDELLTDIGLGKRVASIVAKRLVKLLGDLGERPDPLLLSMERFTAHETFSQGSVVVDGSDNASVQYALCCHPLPGDPILGYLGHGEGLVIHLESCQVAQRLKTKDSERFIAVEWSDETVRSFEASIVVTVLNGKGVLASVAAAITSAEADIKLVSMVDEVSGKEATDLRFLIAVQDFTHLQSVLSSLQRLPAVSKASRAFSQRAQS